MPWDLGELGVMYSSEEVMELRQEDQAKIQKLETYKKMLEEKISKLAPPHPLLLIDPSRWHSGST